MQTNRWVGAVAAAVLLVTVAQASMPASAASRPGVTAETSYELDVVSHESELGGVPDSVVLNVTVTRPRRPGFLTAYPCGSTRPTASNLNFVTAQTVANLVVSKVGSSGKVCLFASQALDLVVDVNGWFPAGSSYRALSPRRLLDTRGGQRLSAGTVRPLSIRGNGGVPNEAVAAQLNVTAAHPAGNGYLTVFPCGSAVPEASNLNFVAGATLPNAVLAPLAIDGSACLYSSVDTDVIVDVAGAFVGGTNEVDPRTPIRVLDTRRSTAAGSGQVVEIPVGPTVGNAKAVVANVTVTNPKADGYVTVYPCGEAVPTASHLNMVAGQTVPNLVYVKVGVGGRVCAVSSVSTDLLVDVVAGFPPSSSFRTVAPLRILDTRSLQLPTAPGMFPMPALPSGGLFDGGRPPQIVLLSFDGAGDKAQLNRWRTVAAANPARFTFFLSGVYLLTEGTRLNYQPPRRPAGSSAINFAAVPQGQTGATWIPDLVSKLHQMEDEGHELGTHYVGHFCGSGGVNSWSGADWRVELDEVDKLASNAGPNNGADPIQSPHRNGIVGGRTPCLEGQFGQLYPVLVERGFRYDASATRYEWEWPKSMAGGFWQFGVPTIPLAGRDTLAADYTISKNVFGSYEYIRSVTKNAYLGYFDRRYYGNRAPIELAGHTTNIAGGAVLDAMADVVSVVCGKPEVRCITYEDAVGWLDQHASDIAAYQRGQFAPMPR